MRYSRNVCLKDVRKNVKEYEDSLTLFESIPNDLIMQYAKNTWRMYDAHHKASSRGRIIDAMLYTSLKNKIDESLNEISDFCETHEVKILVK